MAKFEVRDPAYGEAWDPIDATSPGAAAADWVRMRDVRVVEFSGERTVEVLRPPFPEIERWVVTGELTPSYSARRCKESR